MTSHDLPVDEVRKLLEADKKKSHTCVFDHALITSKGTNKYCKCGKWEDQ